MRYAENSGKRKLIIFICVVVLLAVGAFAAFGSCGDGKTADKELDAVVGLAVDELYETWTKVYDDIGDMVANGSFKTTCEEDRILDIRGVRVIKINSNGTTEFSETAYLVEFELYSNRYRTAPYYTRETIYDSVIVYKDNQTQIRFENDLSRIADEFDNETVIGLVGEEYYFAEEYNQKINLNK